MSVPTCVTPGCGLPCLEYAAGKYRSLCRKCFNRTRDGGKHVPSDVKCVSPGKYTPGCPCGYCKRTARKNGDAVAAAAGQPVIKKVPEVITQIEEHRLKRRVRELEEQRQELLAQLDEGNVYNEVCRDARDLGPIDAHIRPRERKSNRREGTPLVLASDWHVEQNVDPAAVAGRNRYNLEIAKQRMRRFFEAFRWGVRQQRDTFLIRDAILWCGGDFIQNFLHEDDVENNLLPPLEATRFWMGGMIEGLDFLLEDPEIEQYILPMNDGNHGRTTKKMRSSTRQKHSLETFAYAQLALHYRNEPRLKFILPTSQFTFLDDVYGRTIRFLHGDVFKYQGGVGGITVPLFRAMARWEKTKHADLTVLGHFHQRYCLPDCMVNGSLIGYDSYAMGGGFPFEAPVQSMRMLDSKRWTSSDVPLYVADRSDDIMNRK